MMRKVMDKAEVGSILSALADCLSKSPDQFSFVVNVHIDEVTGLRVEGGVPGAPTTFQATMLGGTAENVIGANIQTSVGGADLNVIQGQADREFRGQIHRAAQLLHEIADEVNDGDLDPSSLADKVTALGKLAIPVMVVEMTRLLLRSMGLPL